MPLCMSVAIEIDAAGEVTGEERRLSIGHQAEIAGADQFPTERRNALRDEDTTGRHRDSRQRGRRRRIEFEGGVVVKEVSVQRIGQWLKGLSGPIDFERKLDRNPGGVRGTLMQLSILLIG